jgi:hypothetical protein
MATTDKQSPDEARRLLLEEGARSYGEAFTALVEFRREVEKKCRAVLTNALGRYSAALKVPLASADIRDANWPSLEKWDGDSWCLGVSIINKKTKTTRWWSTTCALQEDSGQHGLFCWIGACLPNKKIADELYRAFQSHNGSVQLQDDEVWLEHPLTPVLVPNLEEPLEGLIDQWVELWQKVGGICDFIKRTSASADDSEET